MSHVRKFLDLSTGHLTTATRQRLDSGEFPTLGMTGVYGWLCYCDADSMSGVSEVWGRDMHDCMALGVKLGVDYIMFDQDGPTYAGLPYYED